ncbi:MAG: acyl carrier protein [Planctomycetes bacterium]|nr:acyl carrier protein [Planctomycetota bacterium]
MAMSNEEAFKKVQVELSAALGVDEEEVTPEATLVGDLGAESIDFLDIVFRLEKAFSIKVNQGELFPESVLNNPQFVQGDKVTDGGMAELRKVLPYIDLDAFDKNRNKNEFPNFIKVSDLVAFVQSKTA